MSQLEASNYRQPEYRAQPEQRCRDCGSARKDTQYGNRLRCDRHEGIEVRHSFTCDLWHARGTLL